MTLKWKFLEIGNASNFDLIKRIKNLFDNPHDHLSAVTFLEYAFRLKFLHLDRYFKYIKSIYDKKV